MAPGAPHKPLSVMVIADSRETLGGLHDYFEGAGVASKTSRQLADVASVAAGTTAVVLFPDEFDAAEVTRRIASLRRARGRVFLLVVTNSPQAYRPALEPDEHSPLPLVLPRPAFGWSLLDAIRAHAQGAPR